MADSCELFLKMNAAWRTRIPKPLQGTQPELLLSLMKLADKPEGISQASAASELGLTQWGLSKLKRKLLRQGWIKVWNPASDRRQLLMTTSSKARSVIAELNVEMAGIAAMSAKRPSQRKVLAVYANSPTLLDLMNLNAENRLREDGKVNSR